MNDFFWEKGKYNVLKTVYDPIYLVVFSLPAIFLEIEDRL